MKKSMVLLATVALLVALLASAGYAVRDTHVMKHWHPMFVEPALGYFGLSFFGHDHTRHVHRVEDGAFVRAPITSCWNYDFLERDMGRPCGSTRDATLKGTRWLSAVPALVSSTPARATTLERTDVGSGGKERRRRL